MKAPLTDKELGVLAFMRDFARTNDMLPPCQVIAARFGCASSTATYAQRRLEAKGWIEKNAVGKYRFSREGATA